MRANKDTTNNDVRELYNFPIIARAQTNRPVIDLDHHATSISLLEIIFEWWKIEMPKTLLDTA